MIRRWIEVSFQKEGIHRYPAAETDPRLSKVAFLAHPHRHIFHFYIKMEVFHNDREVEFILLKRELESLFEDKTLNIDYKSCEMLAENIINYLMPKYNIDLKRDIEVRVYEDDENGGIVQYVKD